jgi:hypothetical protein
MADTIKKIKVNNTNYDIDATYINGSTPATVATSGSYNDLSNKPTIPTVNNGTLTIQKNGTNVTTFTANQSTNATANITVPTKTSELTNDSGFKTTDTNTTYSIDTTTGNTITLTGSDGTTKTKTINNVANATSATTATSATKATQDSDGNVINTTYLKKTDECTIIDLTGGL